MIYRLLFIATVMTASIVNAQDEVKRNMFFGNQAFVDADYEKAAAYYLDAVDQSPLNFKANYNLANAYYRMNQHDKALERINTVVNLAPTSFDKAKAFHNIGNSHMMKQDWEKAIDAYKDGLRLNPSDEETRYNLAYALEMQKKQDEQDREQNGNGGQGAGNSDDENEGDPQESDESNDSENSDQTDPENNSDDSSNGEQNSDPEGTGQSYEAKLSKEQIKNILDSYYMREQELQKRLNKNKKVGYGSKQKKDW